MPASRSSRFSVRIMSPRSPMRRSVGSSSRSSVQRPFLPSSARPSRDSVRTVKDGSKRKRDHWFTLRERVKPWGVIFSRMLTDASATDRIAFSMTGGSINRICISAADARALRNLDLRHTQPGVIAPRCSQRDALEILNLPAKHAHLLKRFAGADDEWLMDWGDVLRFAGDRITLTEMSARVDMNGAKLEALLESEGCPRSDDFGWLRTSALKALSRT